MAYDKKTGRTLKGDEIRKNFLDTRMPNSPKCNCGDWASFGGRCNRCGEWVLARRLKNEKPHEG